MIYALTALLLQIERLKFLDSALTRVGYGYKTSAHSAEWQDDDYAEEVTSDDMCGALLQSDVDMVEGYLSSFPITFVNTIFNELSPVATRFTTINDLCSYEQDVYKVLLDCDLASLHDFVRDGKSASLVAEVMCYYIDWYRKTETAVA